MATESLNPVSALDAIRSAARAAVDAPEHEWGERHHDLRMALGAYDDLLSAWAEAMGNGEQYTADQPPPQINRHRSGPNQWPGV